MTCVAWLSVDSAPQSMVLSSCCVIIIVVGQCLQVSSFMCTASSAAGVGTKSEAVSMKTNILESLCAQTVTRLLFQYRHLSIILYYLLQMINVGKQREMFRVSESNCGQISHSQREQTASRMLQVCLLACS